MVANKFDEILTQIGTGKWNFFYFFTTTYWNMQLLPQTLGSAFLAPAVSYTCQAPEGGYTITSTTYTPTGRNNTSTEKCHYYTNSTKNGGGFERKDCVLWDYDNSTFTGTITSEFHLVCNDEYLRATYQSMYMFGTFIGAPLNGILSDRYGRKTTLSVGSLIYICVVISTCWAPNFSAILASRFVLGLMHPAGMQSGYILSMEVCEPKWRSVVGIVLSVPWALATMAWGGFAYLVRDWRWLQLTVSLPALLFFPFLLVLDESPRWLIVKGHFDRARTALQRAARWNNAQLPPPQELNFLMKTIQKESAEAKQTAAERRLEGLTLRQRVWQYICNVFILFRTPKLRKITLIMYLKFFAVSMVFYGMSLNAINYSADPFVYMTIGGAAELPAYILMAPIVAHAGRKIPNIICYFLCGVAILTLAFIPSEISWLVMTLAMVGKMCISAAFQIIYLYSTELFPTEVRLLGLGSSTIASRLGSMISPFITDYLGPLYPWVPSAIFGSASIVAGLATIGLQETLNTALPDTITDLEGRNTAFPALSEEDADETEMAKLRA